MDHQRTDFLVGLFVLVTAGVVVGTLIVTSDLGIVRNDLYMRIASAEDLTSDTRVLLQGLQVGRVRQVNPVSDSLTQRIGFVARLSVQDRFPNGTELTLPRGTRAVVSQPTPIAPTVVELVLPERPPAGAFLQPGDTLDADRPRNALEALGEIALEIRGELEGLVTDTRALLVRAGDAVAQTQGTLRTTVPMVQEALGRLADNLDRTDAILSDIQPRVGPLHDSLTATLADARQLLLRMDTLVSTTTGLALDNRDAVGEIAESLRRSAQVLEHFTDQISRRPTRLLTGVTPPPPPDSSRSPR